MTHIKASNNQYTFFDCCRILLLDPSNEGSNTRKMVSLQSSSYDKAAKRIEIVLGSIAAVSSIAMARSSAFACVAIPSFLAALGTHDFRVMSQNLKKLVDAKFHVRALAVISPERFTQTYSKGTLVGRTYLGPYLFNAINNAKISERLN